MSYPIIVLKSDKEQSVKRRHPWIFSGAIKEISSSIKEGEIVRVVDNNKNFLALGHYQHGTIAVRILSFDDVEINYNFWEKRFIEAFDLRKTIGLINNDNTNVYRLVHGEGDYLPGLIVDIYDSTAVFQFHSLGMYAHKSIFVDILKNLYGQKISSIYNKSESTLPVKPDQRPKNEYLIGKPSKDFVIENGKIFYVDWEEGQKTGFFIDQRDNRKLLEKYSKGRSVLNTFCYTGGFSVYAIHGGARMVHSVDSSQSAISLTTKNINKNNFYNIAHTEYIDDVMNFFKNNKENYDLIILDPPAFAKHNASYNNALIGYKRLNQKAIEQITKNGIIFTFSCSQVISKEDFRKTVFVAAANTGRKVTILHQLSQPADHPISVYHPEGEYLKGLVLYIE